MRDASADPKLVVRAGYDRISEAYRADTFEIEGTWYETALRALDHEVPAGARVLDLGCGCGVPIAQRLARTHDVTGVDFSERQIDRARALVPEATFARADMTSVEFPPESFDAVVSIYAIIHVPVNEQPRLFDAIAPGSCRAGSFSRSSVIRPRREGWSATGSGRRCIGVTAIAPSIGTSSRSGRPR